MFKKLEDQNLVILMDSNIHAFFQKPVNFAVLAQMIKNIFTE